MVGLVDICTHMLRHVAALLFACLGFGLTTTAQPADSLEQWFPLWQRVEDGKWRPVSGWHSSPIGFFSLAESRSSQLYLKARTPFTWWINNRLQGEANGWLKINADSLQLAAGRDAQIGVHAPGGLATVQVFRPKVAPHPWHTEKRPATYFRDFVIVVSVLLAGCAIALWRLSPRLFFDYLNFVRLMNVRPRDEPQLLRITGSQNILYYFMLAAWLSLLLLVLAENTAPAVALLTVLKGATLGGWFARWLLLTLLIVLLLFTKYFFQYLLAVIYAVQSTVADQFNTFVRLGYFFCLLVSGLLLAAHLAETGFSAPYFRAVMLLLLLSLAIVPFLWIRLIRASALRFFHIFSYLCITEVIPLIITFKILFY